MYSFSREYFQKAKHLPVFPETLSVETDKPLLENVFSAIAKYVGHRQWKGVKWPTIPVCPVLCGRESRNTGLPMLKPGKSLAN